MGHNDLPCYRVHKFVEVGKSSIVRFLWCASVVMSGAVVRETVNIYAVALYIECRRAVPLNGQVGAFVAVCCQHNLINP